MDLNSAYSKLGLQPNASDKDVKKAFRDLSKKYHPDQNKELNAAEKYKEITEAYNFINNPSEQDKHKQNPFSNQGFGFGGFSDFDIGDLFNFGNQKQSKIRHSNSINHTVNLSFEESILGKNIKIKIDRLKGCDHCDGDGEFELNNGCKDCGGKGKKVIQNANFVTVAACSTCKGKRNKQTCNHCSGSGEIKTNSEYDVQIPGGVIDGNILKMQNAGNFIGKIHGGLLHTDVLINIKVQSKPGFKLEDNLVKTTYDLNLLDALIGKKVKIETVIGEKEIDIKPKTKNNEKIIIPNAGVNKQYPHEVTLNINYPNDCEKLIDFLKNNY